MCQVVIVGYKKEFYYPVKNSFFFMKKKCFLKNWLLLISITMGGSNILLVIMRSISLFI